VLPPTLHVEQPIPQARFAESPFYVNSEARPWIEGRPGRPRRAGVSAFGFGGTNFHAVLEEYIPGLHRSDREARSFASADVPRAAVTTPVAEGVEQTGPATAKASMRGALVLGGRDEADLVDQLQQVLSRAASGAVPPSGAPDPALADAAVRVAIDYADAADLATKAGKAVKAFATGTPALWKMLRAQGVFVGRGPAPKVAFLYTGQGSQYVNMLQDLRGHDPVVEETFAEADRVLTPLL
jgi:acyl transferase domain-containing protein